MLLTSKDIFDIQFSFFQTCDKSQYMLCYAPSLHTVKKFIIDS